MAKSEQKPAKAWELRLAIQRRVQEERRREAEALLEKLAEGPYSGFIMAYCEACGAVDGYRLKDPGYAVHCRSCGTAIPLERMRPLHVNCPCGGRWNYLTNVRSDAGAWSVRCYSCGRALEVRMGKKGKDWIAGAALKNWKRKHKREKKE